MYYTCSVEYKCSSRQSSQVCFNSSNTKTMQTPYNTTIYTVHIYYLSRSFVLRFTSLLQFHLTSKYNYVS